MITFQSYSPPKDATNVARNTPIYFEVRDTSAANINANTLNVTIDGNDAILNGVFQGPEYSGNIIEGVRGYDVYISHTTLFAKSANIAITINIQDIGTNLYDDNYLFTILTDDLITPATIAYPKGGLYASAQDVTLLSSKSDATIYYTLDGSMPDISSTVYTVPITINQETTIKFFSVDSDSNEDYVHVEIYQFDTIAGDITAPVTTSDKPEGTYNELSHITLTASEVATIYWTLNGVNPTIENYDGMDTSPVKIDLQDEQNVLRFFAVDLAGNTEALKTLTYIIQPKENNVVPTNVIASFPYIKNTVDICWDDMMPVDSDVIGYNIYRSQVGAQYLKNIVSHEIITSDMVYSTEDSTFHRINNVPVATTFYRDEMINRIVVQENVSNQFKYKTPIESETDFEGQFVDENKWLAIDDDRLFNQSDGLNFVDVYGNNRESLFFSRFRLRGGFDIETEYVLKNWPITDPIYFSEAAFIVSFNKFTYVKIARVKKEAADYYVSTLVVNSTEVSKTEVATTDLDGQFKIMRSGSDVSTYYHDGVSWILIESYLSFSDDDLRVEYYVKSSNTGLNVSFLYFHLTGQAYLPLITNVDGDYCIEVQHKPIIGDVDRNNYNRYTDDTSSVSVVIDGIDATVKSVDGIKGIIVLDTERKYDKILETWIESPVPTPESIVTVMYEYVINSFRINLRCLPHYKVTAILSDGSETRLQWCEPVTLQGEKLDYMYLEAIRRNAWLLDQAGERVLLFLRKSTGERCKCYIKNERTHKQAKVGSCTECWGTGFVGGYEGPFEIKISPFQAEQKIALTDRGMKLDNVEDTWTTVSPIITQRDFIIRRTSEIYAIGPVSRPEVKGAPTQQHFSVEFIDSTDIRHRFVQSLDLFKYSERIGLRGPFKHYSEGECEEVFIRDGEVKQNDRLRTDKGPGTNDPKGRTITFENTLY